MDQYSTQFAGQNSLNGGLDIRQTLRFSRGENPAGKTIRVEQGGEAFQVMVPQNIRNGYILRLPGKGSVHPVTH